MKKFKGRPARARPDRRSRTASAPRPTTTPAAAPLRTAAASRTWAKSGFPAASWRTLGREDFIRVPSPAASIRRLSVDMGNGGRFYKILGGVVRLRKPPSGARAGQGRFDV